MENEIKKAEEKKDIQSEGEEIKNFVISRDLAQAIINYLGYRPLVEVEGLVNGLRKLQLIKKA